ncbi:MAG: HD domain-containing phosphohydrolase, partial [Deferrisomatales bacterium]
MNPPKPAGLAPALRLAAAYAVFGALWIAGSDRLVEALVTDPHRMSVLQTYKGWAFVALSSAVLYLAARHQEGRRERAEAGLRRREALYRTLVESAADLVFIADRDERLQYLNPAGARHLGGDVDGLVGRSLREVLPAGAYDAHARHLAAALAADRPVGFEAAFDAPEPTRWFDATLTPLKGPEGGAAAVLGVEREITDRKRTEADLELQVRRLAALRTVDAALTASLDLTLTLDVVLSHVTSALGVDAACVLLLSGHAPMLEYAAGKGFRSPAVTRTSLRLGEGYAGRAALERTRVQVPDISKLRGPFLPFGLLEKEAVGAYFGVPLVAKGQVKGVLEIFHRAPLDPDPAWLEFLEALATDAAIAIDNVTLFDDLQRANTELILAYDATLEGWGRALELRDEETEGHTQRVTAMAVRLAQAMGLAEAELVHLRRGSFLHDIGKIGIPDRILLKAEPLTDEEWAVMRTHPTYAFRLLQPVRYLRPALDIPYCHHEHWDGSGYPRGLAGEQIPLAARIFAVVDVWDALRSHRSYHEEWPAERVREHLRSLSGTQHDPRAVE